MSKNRRDKEQKREDVQVLGPEDLAHLDVDEVLDLVDKKTLKKNKEKKKTQKSDKFEHYYTKNPSVESNPQTITYEIKQQSLTLTTDRGVFSKNEVDFGTKQLIEYFQMPDLEGDILDLGCGYGPIGLTLAKIYKDRHITMTDVNERAVELAKKNSEENHVNNVSIFVSHLFENITGTFAVIVTNPPIRAGKKTVHHLFEQAVQHLVPKGELWIVIQKKQGAPSAIKKLKSLFANVEVVHKKSGYFVIKAKKD